MKEQIPHAIDYKKLFQSLDATCVLFDVNDPTFTIIEENQAHANLITVMNILGMYWFGIIKLPQTNEYIK